MSISPTETKDDQPQSPAPLYGLLSLVLLSLLLKLYFQAPYLQVVTSPLSANSVALEYGLDQAPIFLSKIWARLSSFLLCYGLPAACVSLWSAYRCQKGLGGNLRFSLKWLAVAWLTIATLIRLFVFNGLPCSSDEHGYIFQGDLLRNGQLWLDLPAQLDPLVGGGTFYQQGRWMSPYQIGWPLLLAVGNLLGIRWVVSILVGLAGLFAVYFCSAELFGKRAARWASVVYLLCPMFLINSGASQVHPAVALVGLISIAALARGLRTRQAPWAALGGLSMAYLLMTRLPEFIPHLPILGILFLQQLGRPKRRASLQTWKCLGLYSLTSSLGLVGVGLVNAAQTGSALKFAFQLANTNDSFVFSPKSGHTPLRGLYHTVLATTRFPFWMSLFGFELALKALSKGSNSVKHHRALALAGGCIFNIGLYFCFSNNEMVGFGPRYHYPCFTFACLLAGHALARFFAVSPRTSSISLATATTGLAIVMAATVLPIAVSVQDEMNFFQKREFYVQSQSIPDQRGLIFIRQSLSNKPRNWIQNDPILSNRLIFALFLDPKQNREIQKKFPGRIPLVLDERPTGKILQLTPLDDCEKTPHQRSESLVFAALNYLYTVDDSRKAESMARQAIQEDPSWSYAYAILATTLQAQKNNQAAAEQLEHALKLDPASAQLEVELGGVYWELGRQEQARACWSNAAQQAQDPDQARRAQQLLSQPPQTHR